jgi:hypothetical protein
MKEIQGMKVGIHESLTSALDGRSTSGDHWIVGFVGLRGGTKLAGKRINMTLDFRSPSYSQST